MIIDITKNEREICNDILETIKQFNHEPKIVKTFIKEQEEVIKKLPLPMKIEIETEYINVK